jgi:tetratricopeptide (TPR) repeat protein
MRPTRWLSCGLSRPRTLTAVFGPPRRTPRRISPARAIYVVTGLDTEQGLNTLSSLAKLEPDPKARLLLLEDVLARTTRMFGATGKRAADKVNDLGNTWRDLGDLPRATAYFEEALALYEKLGPTHARVAIALSNLGELAITQRKFEQAEAWCRRALAIDEKALGPQHPDLAYDLTGLGEAELGRGRTPSAIALLQRAFALRIAAKTGGSDLERTQRALARARRG